jgi:hypothetical protein
MDFSKIRQERSAEMNEIAKPQFDYSALDPQTTEFLKQKESNMRDAVGQAETVVGQELLEARNTLAKHGYGCFGEWFESIGLKKDKVYALISRYELIVGNSDKQELLERLPVSLVYETAKPSTDPALKELVLDGKITSHKQFKDLEKQLKQSESAQAKALTEHTQQQEILLAQIAELKLVKDSPETLQRIAELEAKADREHQLALDNIKLQKRMKDMEQEFIEKLTKREEDTHSVRKLREALRSIVSVVTSEHSSAKYHYSLVSGQKGANEAVQAFIQFFDPLVREIFQTWQDASTITSEEVSIDERSRLEEPNSRTEETD